MCKNNLAFQYIGLIWIRKKKEKKKKKKDGSRSGDLRAVRAGNV